MDTAQMRLGLNIINDWQGLSNAFTAAYSKFKTTRCQVAVLSNLNQQHQESVTKFHTRVAKAMLDMRSLDDACPDLDPPFPAGLTALAGFMAPLLDNDRQQAITNLQTHGDRYRENRMAKHLFVAGLNAKIRDELLKTGIQNMDFNDVFNEALGMERALSDLAHTSKIHAIEGDEIRMQELEAELAAIQQRRGYSRGRGRGRSFSRGGRGRGNGRDMSEITCYHCGKRGHMASACHSRKRGEPPAAKSTAAVETKTDDDTGKDDHPFLPPSYFEPQPNENAQFSAVSADYLN